MDKNFREDNLKDRLIKELENNDVIDDLDNLLQASGHEHELLALIYKLLSEMAKHGIESGINQLNTEERHSLENSIKGLIIQLKKEGKNVNAQDVIKFIMSLIHQNFSEKYSKKLQEQENKSFIKSEKLNNIRNVVTKHILNELTKIIMIQQINNKIAYVQAVDNIIKNSLYESERLELDKRQEELKRKEIKEAKDFKELGERKSSHTLGI
ncbi:MAG: hypothetical protein J0H68_00710 [Sphingobacteriia bacterium]|nr:hypothetical protein [Sphingobacteriia bacterium]